MATGLAAIGTFLETYGAAVGAAAAVGGTAVAVDQADQAKKDEEARLRTEQEKADKLKLAAESEEEQAFATAEEERRKRVTSLAAQGRASTFSTSPLATAGQTSGKTLLGQ